MEYLVKWFLDQKRVASQQKVIKEGKPKSPLPVVALQNIEWLNYWIQSKIPYTGDGARLNWNAALGKWIGIGWPDLYEDPFVISYQVQHGNPDTLSIDCDDVALVAFQGLKELEKRGLCKDPQILNLLANSFHWMWTPPFIFWPSHVVATFISPDGKTGVIDTNGLSFHKNIKDVEIYFGGLYQTTYWSTPVKYPF